MNYAECCEHDPRRARSLALQLRRALRLSSQMLVELLDRGTQRANPSRAAYAVLLERVIEDDNAERRARANGEPLPRRSVPLEWVPWIGWLANAGEAIGILPLGPEWDGAVDAVLAESGLPLTPIEPEPVSSTDDDYRDEEAVVRRAHARWHRETVNPYGFPGYK